MECRQCQPLKDDLHADELQVPAFVGEDLVQQVLEAAGDRIGEARLRAHVAVEDLDVARFVEGLRRRVQLGVEARRAGRQLRRHQQGALLAVQELRQRPRHFVPHELQLAHRGHGFVGRIALPGTHLKQLLDARRRRLRPFVPVRSLLPVDVRGAVPVQLLAQLVEPPDAVVRHPVVPVVGAGERRAEELRHMRGIRLRHVELRVELLQAARYFVHVVDVHCSSPFV